MSKRIVPLTLNGDACELVVEPHRSLLDALRFEGGLTGTKKGCDVGECGSCTVLLDGKPVCACLVLAAEVGGSEIVTIEGVQPSPDRLHPLQENFMKCGAAQCGFCTPGMVVAATALIERKGGAVDRNDVLEALGGHYCRCTGYVKIVDAVMAASRSEVAV
jgi:carbon-monoxide dehydrogenase small subunit